MSTIFLAIACAREKRTKLFDAIEPLVPILPERCDEATSIHGKIELRALRLDPEQQCPLLLLEAGHGEIGGRRFRCDRQARAVGGCDQRFHPGIGRIDPALCLAP